MKRLFRTTRARPNAVAYLLFVSPVAALAQPAQTIDIAELSTQQDLLRIQGSEGNGAFGVPVAGGTDVDGDGFADVAMAAMTASPDGRSRAGTVYLLFGDGKVEGAFDTADTPEPRVLRIFGDQALETAGSEIWIDDVTGDGLGDLLICRQNYSPDGRPGAGAVTILPGSSRLRELAASGQVIDLRTPPPELSYTTLVGRESGGRLGIWLRTGDVDGDGVADLLVGADQETSEGKLHGGAAYLVRGGPFLDGGIPGNLADLSQWESPTFPLAGALLRISASPARAHGHFGATVQVGDIDGNGRAEVAAAEALARAGASLQPAAGRSDSLGGAPDGTLHLIWDAAFADPWPPGATVTTADFPSLVTKIDGSQENVAFGEEILLGGDYDGDGRGDLFVGDLVAASPNGNSSGLGSIFFGAADLAGQSFVRDQPPPGSRTTTFYGPEPGAIGADTAVDGDFDGDGRDDLVFSAPHASPLGRASAGQLYVFLGRPDWPEIVDLRPGKEPAPEALGIVSILGAKGTSAFDIGDTLAYSAAAGDLDRDGRTDLITNEMLGNGSTPSAIDTGNLIALSGALIQVCVSDPTTHCLRDDRFAVTAHWRTSSDQGSGRTAPLTPDSGTFWFFQPTNVEVIVKVLAGCSINDRYWVFAAGLTNVGVTLEVRDTRTGVTQTYDSPLGTAFQPIQDTAAFACP